MVKPGDNLKTKLADINNGFKGDVKIKLAGEYLKIFPKAIAEHRLITAFLSATTYLRVYLDRAFAADSIPSLDQIGGTGALIVNKEKSDCYGEHWLAMIVLENRILEFFDSFGRSPTEFNAHITNFVCVFPEVHWKSPRFQSPETLVCGYYCIYYITMRYQEDHAVRDDGSVLTVKRIYPKLTPDAYPSIFPNQPAYLSSDPVSKRKTPSERRNEMLKRDEKKIY
ncbi:hypothetical protein CEXT_743661 [Caerostris extrusa]|uniref:Ubiquitin-like protease family profile domain-containing protein n=1 Tax=Caerostris extrusa TaxID=172846 RepID=A0AAV4WWM3_CAEEX|nr:hypothetical protein CEXT_743661 [Caerostris extrusa]